MQRLVKLREDTIALRMAITARVADEGRTSLTAEETRQFEAFTDTITDLDEQIVEAAEEDRRAGRGNPNAVLARRAHARLDHISEPQTYARGNGQSYVRDLILTKVGRDDSGDAMERLKRHATDVSTDRDYRALDRTPGNGGYFTPPKYLLDQLAPLARAGRPYANIVQSQVLANGVSSVKIPKVTSGTAVAMQTADNAPVAQQDLDDAEIDARVRTVAGQQPVAIQLLEQSPVPMDEVIFADLFADYAAKLDRQVLAGSNSNGQVKGVRNTPGIHTVALTSATVQKLYGAIADSIQRIHTTRFLPPTHIAMHPRRWAWLIAAFDNGGRPLSVPSAQVPANAIAVLDTPTSEGVVGAMQGLPVVADPNIGTTYGAGGDEDVVYVQRSADLLLWESSQRSRVLLESQADTLTVLLQVYGYIAFSAERYPTAVAEIAGLPTPTFG